MRRKINERVGDFYCIDCDETFKSQVGLKEHLKECGDDEE
jgi:hypothetical protein